jgi:hypothetical protein
MQASLAAHAAARQTSEKSAIAAARAAGQAAATAHMADHSMGALLYAMKALALLNSDTEPELKLRLAKLPPHLREPVSFGVNLRRKTLGIP